MTDSFQRLWSELSGMTDNAKKIGLRGQKRYYYIFSIGTEVEYRGRGRSTGFEFLAINILIVLQVLRKPSCVNI